MCESNSDLIVIDGWMMDDVYYVWIVNDKCLVVYLINILVELQINLFMLFFYIVLLI